MQNILFYSLLSIMSVGSGGQGGPWYPLDFQTCWLCGMLVIVIFIA